MTAPPKELDNLLHELDSQIPSQDDAVSKARASLESTLAGLELSPEESSLVAQEVAALKGLFRKLEAATIEIAAFGMVSRGKSSVLNALLGRDVFEVGATHGTTITRVEEDWKRDDVGRPGLEGTRLVLVDTPGIDEVGGEGRERLALDAARQADLILFIVSGDLQRGELEALSILREVQKPIILVFNQIDRYPDVDRETIHSKIKDERVAHLIKPEDVVMTSARPDPYRVRIERSDGATIETWERPAPVIEPLKTRILDVLEREGKALVALNTLLIAGDLHAEIVARKVRIREEAANQMIWNFALATGAAVGLNPIPVADVAGGLALDVGMIVALGKLYGLPLTRRTATSLVRDMMLALGAMGAVGILSRLVTSGVRSSLAGITLLSGGLAAPLTALGYAAASLAQAAAAATTTYVLGHGAKHYLRQGCQWGPRGIKTVIQEILTQAQADSVIDRLREDLKKKLKS